MCQIEEGDKVKEIVIKVLEKAEDGEAKKETWNEREGREKMQKGLERGTDRRN